MFKSRIVRSYFNMLISSKLMNVIYGAKSEAQYQITNFKNITNEVCSLDEDVEIYILDAKLQSSKGWNNEQIYFNFRLNEHGTFSIIILGTIVEFNEGTYDFEEFVSLLNTRFSIPIEKFVSANTNMTANINFSATTESVLYYSELDIGGMYHNNFIGDIVSGNNDSRLSEISTHIFNVMTSFLFAPFFNARLMVLV